METVFFNRFERHDHGKGLKAHTTHYCPGCGHGLVHKFVAEAIDELGVQDRTVAISPVGCAVFLYYYLDVGNTQAAHGRAPAVAIGHKLANPGSIVISYQGDGDLASIGLAEILQLAQLGLPISVIFVNNAIYAMTGGQLAPTTLLGQTTTTSPYGRDRSMGEPLRMSELIASLEGPVYVERVGLFNNKQRMRARKAIKKSIKLQVENRGLSFVEVLSECPTHLKLTPEESERWVEEHMVPVFPLGVKKDPGTSPETREPWSVPAVAVFDPQAVLDSVGASSEPTERFAESFPTHIDEVDVAVKFAGAGGDGAQTIARLSCVAAINEGFDSTYIPSYGPESRGGTSYADVHIAADEVLSPSVPEPHALVAFNAPSLERFGPTVVRGGTIIYDSSVIPKVPVFDKDITMIGIPCTQIAHDLGNTRVKNIAALGALQAATDFLPDESCLTALRQALHDRSTMIPLNEEAFALGQKAVLENEPT